MTLLASMLLQFGWQRKSAHHSLLRVQLTEEQQRIVAEERSSHPNLRIRERMLVLWLLHLGLKRQKTAEIVGVGRATVQRYVAAFRETEAWTDYDKRRSITPVAKWSPIAS
jgi:hypothetical protein